MLIALACMAHMLVILLVGAVPLSTKISERTMQSLLAFGAGVLMAAAFLHMLPVAYSSLGASTGLIAIFGFGFMAFIDKVLGSHPVPANDHPGKRVGAIAFVGLSVHSVLSGMALGIGLSEAESFAIAVALMAAILVHKIPETFAFVGILAGSRWKQSQIWPVLIAFALMGPAGILMGASIDFHYPKAFALALALSAGTFLFIAGTEILPRLHREMKPKGRLFVYFLLGVIFLSFDAWHHLFGQG
jgi:zinc and cadmium transporter